MTDSQPINTSQTLRLHTLWLAAALRAAADQVVPQPKYSWDVSSENRFIRRQLLAIAAELEGGND